MKKTVLKMASGVMLCSVLLTSCYSYTSMVGEGAKGSQEVTQWNHYLIFGLAPVNVSDSKKMANGATDYTVTTKQSFVNGLVAGLTFGIYTPSTTIVKK